MKPTDMFFLQGLARGRLTHTGLSVLPGFDADGSLSVTRERNNPRPTFVHVDVQNVTEDDILDDRRVSSHDYPVLARGVPCQSFSTLIRGQQRRSDVRLFGPRRWGRDYIAPDAKAHPSDQILELDHVTPISGGGSHYLSNRALLCRPCNGDGSDIRTIVWLRQQAGYATGGKQGTRHEIDLEIARLRIEEHVRGLGE